jgi:hypothetical protein
MLDTPPEGFGPEINHLLSHPLPPPLDARRTEFLAAYHAAQHELRERYTRVCGELVLHEIEYLVLCGWPREQAYLPALNNQSAKLHDVLGEYRAGIARLQDDLRRRLEGILEELSDE